MAAGRHRRRDGRSRRARDLHLVPGAPGPRDPRGRPRAAARDGRGGGLRAAARAPGVRRDRALRGARPHRPGPAPDPGAAASVEPEPHSLAPPGGGQPARFPRHVRRASPVTGERAAPQLTLGIRNYAAAPPEDWRHVLDQARAAEDAGLDRVFVSDHVVFGPDLGAYGDPGRGGRAGGRQPTGPDGDWLESLTVLASLAAVTSRVRLATNVLVAPLRPPVLLAKVAATIDALSGGRLELGVGIGWQEAEYRALGVDFSKRGQVLDELLAACRELWTSPVAAFEGRHVRFADVHMMPKPVRASGVPVWIGGSVRPVVARRIVRHGVGWIPWGVTAGDFGSALREMRRLVESEGGDFGGVQVAYPLTNAFRSGGRIDYPAMFAAAGALAEQGVTDFRTLLRVPHRYDEARSMLDEMVREFAGAVG
ncbi:TIGR03619 family F420-dependent LLM class oxidoreductase [Actinomadura sp. KC345]|nr:TIGR03619 family F420-dependent LLM class oxidoreductase [Actinomadura sp. KC345]